jgi:hypothetical protein
VTDARGDVHRRRREALEAPPADEVLLLCGAEEDACLVAGMGGQSRSEVTVRISVNAYCWLRSRLLLTLAREWCFRSRQKIRCFSSLIPLVWPILVLSPRS